MKYPRVRKLKEEFYNYNIFVDKRAPYFIEFENEISGSFLEKDEVIVNLYTTYRNPKYKTTAAMKLSSDVTYLFNLKEKFK